ncbi:rhomboid family intramembrane serine protease [Desulfurobacterium atlanticum]|uniref:Membrane associated serine protease, rhomboid family n=1 Tax=Desulfurobacterium atlanticum TaxID=240169 RepID=A0A238ZT74_9BACT|nr:rhomboid family intramembrane serine protease [Desulfurobacterium atlanticum]SNR86201.1 Membrane associated serine protease, rhomboid family [Desulfurobacterium atlanticum]
MIPLKDLNKSRTVPVVTTYIIVICVIIFLFELSMGRNVVYLFHAFGVIPYEIVRGVDIPPPDPLTPYGNLISHQYLHGGFFHIIGNMLFLWIFGDNVEDYFGKLKFFIFYTFCGVMAALMQVFAYPDSVAPLIGASGAISGVLGAYFVLYPNAKIVTLVFLGFFVDLIVVPAYIWILFWFLMQFLSLLASTSVNGVGVAWFAHIGGFIVGMLITRFAITFKGRPLKVIE